MGDQRITKRRKLELYLHIPFCVRKCEYCDFLSFPAERNVQRAYLEALKREIELFPEKDKYYVSTVFFGGGTPSVLPAEWISELMDTLRSGFRFFPRETGEGSEYPPPKLNRTPASGYKTIIPNYKTPAPGYKTTTPNDKTTVSEYKTTVPNDKTPAPGYKTTIPNDKTTVSEYKTTIPNDKTPVSEYKTEKDAGLPDNCPDLKKNGSDTGILSRHHEPEITIECNPGTADEGKLRIYRAAGINRVSFGLQSAHDSELAILGRIHTWGDFLRTYEAARRAGFYNINVDLMSALPGQTVKSWEETLRRVLRLAPEHISAYSLMIEPGTPFYEKYAKDAARRERGEQPHVLPSEEDERQMYYLTEELLSAAGFWRYEISNYALPGFECRHNIGYWDGTEYAGFGLGASSLLRMDEGTSVHGVENKIHTDTGNRDSGSMKESVAWETKNPVCGEKYVRVRNPEAISSYLAGDFSEKEIQPLTAGDRMEEFMFLGLRMTQGIREQEFTARFSRTIDDVYGSVLNRLLQTGLLQRTDGRISLTRRGFDVSNTVMAEFLL